MCQLSAARLAVFFPLLLAATGRFRDGELRHVLKSVPGLFAAANVKTEAGRASWDLPSFNPRVRPRGARSRGR